MNTFTSGKKRSYYGKGDVIVYRLNRDGKTAAGASPFFGDSSRATKVSPSEAGRRDIGFSAAVAI